MKPLTPNMDSTDARLRVCRLCRTLRRTSWLSLASGRRHHRLASRSMSARYRLLASRAQTTGVLLGMLAVVAAPFCCAWRIPSTRKLGLRKLPRFLSQCLTFTARSASTLVYLYVF